MSVIGLLFSSDRDAIPSLLLLLTGAFRTVDMDCRRPVLHQVISMNFGMQICILLIELRMRCEQQKQSSKSASIGQCRTALGPES